MTARLIGLLAAMVLLVGCGVPPQDGPQPLPGETGEVPSEESSPSATGTARIRVYLVEGARLVSVQRQVGSVHDVEDAVAVLLIGPRPVEASSGLRSAIPAGTASVPVDIDGEVAEVQLPIEFAQLDGDQQILAVAQLVFTLTENARVDGVRLTDGERDLRAPTDSGRLVSRPVRRADYDAVAPEAGSR